MAVLESTTKITILVEGNPHKAGTKNASLFEKVKVCTTVAEALEAGLTKSNLMYWNQHKMLSLEGVASPVSSKPGRRSAPTSTPTRTGKNLVYLFGKPDLVATMIQPGEQQSVVRLYNGNERVVNNTWITPVEEKSNVKEEGTDT